MRLWAITPNMKRSSKSSAFTGWASRLRRFGGVHDQHTTSATAPSATSTGSGSAAIRMTLILFSTFSQQSSVSFTRNPQLSTPLYLFTLSLRQTVRWVLRPGDWQVSRLVYHGCYTVHALLSSCYGFSSGRASPGKPGSPQLRSYTNCKNASCLNPVLDRILCRCEYSVFSGFPVSFDSSGTLTPDKKNGRRRRSVRVRPVAVTHSSPQRDSGHCTPRLSALRSEKISCC